jgi:hypothetical protein
MLKFKCAGLYLFMQVQYPLSLVYVKYKHFLVFGLGREKIPCVLYARHDLKVSII